MSDHTDSTPMAPFNEAHGFRETFLHHFTESGDREALLRLSEILFAYWGEVSLFRPEQALSDVHADLRAVANDLRYLESFLLHVVGKAPEVFHLAEQEVELSILAQKMSGHLGELAEILDLEVERSLPP